MRREINHEDKDKEAKGKMNRSGSPRATKERIAECEIHVFLRTGEARGNHYNDRDGRLQRPATTVIADTMDRPEQQRRHNKMKERKQPNPQWEPRVEQVLRAANQMVPQKKSPAGVERPHKVNQQGGYSLAGYEQHIISPQTDASENDGDVA